MSGPMNDQEQQGCAILIFSGCATLIGFLLGFAAAVVLAARGGW